MSEAPLRAVPDDTATPLKPAPAAAGEPLRPVLPDWLRSLENLRSAARRRVRLELHRAAYHGVRSPWYGAKTLFWGVTGSGWLFLLWLRWWLMPVPVAAHQQAAGEGWRAWKTLHQAHRKATKVRALISLAVAVPLAAGVVVACRLAPWTLGVAGAVLVVTAAIVARPEGARIVTPHAVPAEYEKLTQDVIVRALGAIGIAPIDRWLREGKQIVFPHPVRQDGPGWRAEIDLPFGVTAAQVIERREQLASGLRRPLGAVWPEPVSSEHTGRLELWVGQQDISKAKAPPWPLLRSGQADVFAPQPFGVDMRGRQVKVPSAYLNMLIGSIPRQGKTATVRVRACTFALDPLCELWVHELKGSGDLDPLEQVAYRFVSGIDDASVGYAAESLTLLRREIERRTERLRALDRALCPDKRVTRQIAARRGLKLWPVACVIDECQNLFSHEKYGKQAADDAVFIIKIGPAFGIMLDLATQRPDAKSLPTGVSSNVGLRFCLKVMDQTANDMVLGTSAYKNGIRATTFRPEVDAGLGYLVGASAQPQVVRAYYLDMPATEKIAVRARALREAAGTLAVVADTEREQDVLADVLAAIGGDPGLHWGVLAERLAERYPDRWAGASGDAVSAQCRRLGVPSEDVRYPTTRDGTVLKGAKRDSVVAAASRNIAGQPVGV